MGDKKLRPIRDPNCQKYIDDLNRTWYRSEWKTTDQIERNRERERERYANDPEYREAMKDRFRKRARELYANDPEYRERFRERMCEIRKGLIEVKIAGKSFSYRVPPERKEEVKQKLAEFREQQATNYLEARDGGFNQTVA